MPFGTLRIAKTLQAIQMTNLILHIPHSSDKILMDKGYMVDQKILDQEIVNRQQKVD